MVDSLTLYPTYPPSTTTKNEDLSTGCFLPYEENLYMFVLYNVHVLIQFTCIYPLKMYQTITEGASSSKIIIEVQCS